MKKIVKRALKEGLIRKEKLRECANKDESCRSRKVKHTFSFTIGGGRFGNVCYCEDCVSGMLEWGVES